MKRVNVNDADVAELLNLYERATIQHGRATESGDYKTANRESETIASVYRELRSRGLEAQKALLPLLHHSNIHVRVMAAADALEFAPDQGEPVLIEIAQSRGIAPLNARMTLQEWRKGNLKFP
jgi:uncharacterized protein DUF2019